MKLESSIHKIRNASHAILPQPAPGALHGHIHGLPLAMQRFAMSVEMVKARAPTAAQVAGLERLNAYLEEHKRGELNILRPGQIPIMQAMSQAFEHNLATTYIEATTGVGKGFCLVEAMRLKGGKNLVL